MEINEKEVMIKGNFSIAATVTYTDERKKSPTVVIIMGTGKLDRDGNGLGFHSDMYKDLAHKFTEYGFVSARYDKRGTHKSGGNFNAAGLILLGGAGMCMKEALNYQNTLLDHEVSDAKGLLGAILRKSFKLDKQLAMIDDMFEKST